MNNAGVAHYKAFVDLSARDASEILHVKVLCTTLLAQAAARGMAARKTGVLVKVAGMLAFGESIPIEKVQLGRAVYTATSAHIVALSQTIHEDLKSSGVRVQVLCPGIVATEFHERQGFDLSKYPRMFAVDVVTASLRGLELGELVCAPGVEGTEVLDAAFQAGLTAFAAQSSELAQRYRPEQSMHKKLLYAAYGYLLVTAVLHYLIDVVAQYVRKHRAPSAATTIYWGLHSAYSLDRSSLR